MSINENKHDLHIETVKYPIEATLLLCHRCGFSFVLDGSKPDYMVWKSVDFARFGKTIGSCEDAKKKTD